MGGKTSHYECNGSTFFIVAYNCFNPAYRDEHGTFVYMISKAQFECLLCIQVLRKCALQAPHTH